MKFPMNRFGLLCDPRRAHVTMPWKGRTLLGEVRGCKYDYVCGVYRLTVHYFNGEPWPVEPRLLAVDVLER